jgi:hypothetical protein
MCTAFLSENLKGRDNLGNPGVDGKIINKLKGIKWKCAGWIHLSQDKDQRQAVVNTMTNRQVPYEAVNF